MRIFVLFFLFLYLLLFPFGCTSKGIINSYLISTLEGTQASLQQSKNHQLVERALPPFIVMVDAAIADDPENVALLIKGAQLHVGYALSFIEDKDPAWAALHYENAREYTFRAIQVEYDIQSHAIVGQEENKVKKLLAEKFSKENIQDLFWWGMSWGLWINANRENIKSIGEFPYVRLIMEHALFLDPTYENGMPHLFFGLYYGSIHKTLGGEPEKGKEHFEKILEITKGEWLSAKVLYARTYARTIQDRKLYEKLLNEVLDAPDPVNKDYILSNSLAKKQAETLLGKIDEYFLPEPEEKEEEDF